MEIDMQDYHPRTIEGGDLLRQIVCQAWEMDERELPFIHGHGQTRGSPRPFANTNTGWLGLTVRRILRGADLRVTCSPESARNGI